MDRRSTPRLLVLGAFVLGLVVPSCVSPRTHYLGADAATLARAAQNPVSDLSSLALETELDFGTGVDDDVRTVENVRLSLPVPLDDDWNVVNRLNLPVIDQPRLSSGAGDELGTGNLEYIAWISLADVRQGILAFGPVVVPPTASNDALGPDSWAAGFAVAVLRERGPWLYGAQAWSYWDVPADSDDNIGVFVAQPIVDYDLEDGWYLTSTPRIRADLESTSSKDRWIVPVGGGVGRVFAEIPLNARLQAFYNLEHPDMDGPEWSILFELQFLLTKRGSVR